MQKCPTYIGIFCIEPTSAKELRTYSKQCVEEVLGRVNSLFVQQDYKKFEETFHPPKDNHHITTLFLGGNENALKPKGKQIYKGFKHGINADIKIDVCVYVPGTLMVGFSPDTSGIQCDNAHPHVTLLLGGDTKAVQSNAVLEQVLKEFPNVHNQQFQVKECKTKYKGKSIFLIKKAIKLPGVTGDNFRNGTLKG